MTSRLSFPKLVLETLRRHAAAVLITLLGFFICILSFFMQVQNIVNAEYITEYSLSELTAGQNPAVAEMTADLLKLCSPNTTNALLAAAFGVYLAFDFLRYMHSKRETDFYASLPIRRQTWFKTLFTGSFLLYFVLSAVTTMIKVAIVFGTGYETFAMLQMLLWDFICMLGAFLVTWFTTALAMILTGHSIIAGLGFCAFLCYIPLILANLIPTYCSRFFDTYVSHALSQKVYYFSPATIIYKMTHAWRGWEIKEHWTYLIACFVMALILGIVSYLLFVRRPSEAAGRAMAFEKANSVIRFLIVIPLTLYAGLFLEAMAIQTSLVWLIFGIVFSAFLLHGIVECIYQFDIKALLNHKLQLLASILLCLAFVFSFQFDFWKYDAYIPKAEDVKLIKYESNILGWYNTRSDAERDWIHDDAIKPTLDVIAELKEHNDESLTNDSIMDYITVTYTLKNGREVRRAYSYDISHASDSINQFYASEDVKNDYCQLYNAEKNKIGSLSFDNGLNVMSLELTAEEQDAFIKLFLEEYTKMDLNQMLTDKALYEFTVGYLTENDEMSYEQFVIYSSFEKTIAFLKENGIPTMGESEDCKITNMEIFDYYDSASKYVNDLKQLEQLKPYLTLSSGISSKYGEQLYVEIRYEYNGSTSYGSVLINKSDVDKVLGETP